MRLVLTATASFADGFRPNALELVRVALTGPGPPRVIFAPDNVMVLPAAESALATNVRVVAVAMVIELTPGVPLAVGAVVQVPFVKVRVSVSPLLIDEPATSLIEIVPRATPVAPGAATGTLAVVRATCGMVPTVADSLVCPPVPLPLSKMLRALPAFTEASIKMFWPTPTAAPRLTLSPLIVKAVAVEFSAADDVNVTVKASLVPFTLVSAAAAVPPLVPVTVGVPENDAVLRVLDDVSFTAVEPSLSSVKTSCSPLLNS